MKKLICLLMAVMMLMSVCPAFAAEGMLPIEKLNKIGIITGDENGNLNMDAKISRAEFLALIIRVSGLEDEAKAASGETAFADAVDHWAKGYINVAAEKGIANGVSETEFGVSAPVTFNQAVKMCISMLTFGEAAEEKGGYPEGYLAVAKEKGMLDNLRCDEREITRGEAAEIIFAAMKVCTLKSDGTLEIEDILTTMDYADTGKDVLKVTKNTENLWEEGKMPFANAEANQTPVIKTFLVEGENRPAVVLFPGGAYHHMSVRESQQIPKVLNNLGVSVFLVEYRVTPYTADAIMADGFRAVRHVRANAEQYKINPEKSGVMGLSAGGHLAAAVSTTFMDAVAHIGDAVDKVSARPDFSILCYPVISFTDGLAHKGSKQNFLGDSMSTETIEAYSLEKRVGEVTPPAFIWHTAEDGSVPVENSLEYVTALIKYNIPVEYHIYPKGGHGMAAAKGKRPGEWTSSLGAWLKEMEITE